MTSVKRKLLDTEIAEIIISLNTKKANNATESVHNHLIEKLKNQLNSVQIYPEIFDDFKKNIIRQFFTSKISPGENVGILIAQSIGEKQTQMSIAYDEYIYVKRRNLIENVQIGQFIDKYMQENKKNLVKLSNCSSIISTIHEDFYVPSVNKSGVIGFKKLTMLSKHKPNGNLFKIETKTGHTVLSTGSHSLLTRDAFKNVVPIKAQDVTLNTVMPIIDTWQDIFDNNYKNLSTPMAKILGIFLRCGSVKDEMLYFDISSKQDNKDISEYIIVNNTLHCYDYKNTNVYIVDKYMYKFIIECNSIPLYLISNYNHDTVYNFLTGILPVSYSKSKKKYISINCKTVEFRNDIGLLLKTCLPSCRFDFVDNRIKIKVCDFKTFIQSNKCLWFTKPTVNKIKWIPISKIEEIGECDYAYEYVYDFSVDDNETFVLSNGLFVHNTLNTFHTTGLTVNTVVTGVPRLLELMNATKEPKTASCTITFKCCDTIRSINDVRNYIGNALKCITVNHLIDDYNIVDLNHVKNDWWSLDLGENFADKVLRIQFSHKKIFENRICLSAMVEKINATFDDICVVSSSINECILDVYIVNKDSITLPKKQISYINDDNKYEVFLEEVVLKKFEKFIISGIEKITDFMIYAVTPGKEWVVSTEGSNLKGIMECDLFEPDTIMSNNMWEIYYTLGIEATREFLVNEFINVISSDGTFINKCHVYLLVDFMTFKGDISSISRYSLRNKTSPLARSSFEESIENFLKSGIFTEVDNMKSISSNIMTGKLSHTGTGICDLLVDKNVYFKEDGKINKDNVYRIVNEWLSADVNDDVNNTLVMLPTIFERT